MFEWLIFAAIGVVAGLLSGLLGLGGGVVVVPALLFVFSWQGLAEAHIMHLAIGTSLMTIVVTSLASSYTHNKHQNIDWLLFKRLSLGLVLGGILGAFFATQLPTQLLQYLFASAMLLVAVRMSLPHSDKTNDHLLSSPILFATGTFIGSLSALIGIGGGTLIVPYLTMAKLKIQHAIGTSTACTVPIAIAAVITYLFLGRNLIPDTPWQTAYIHWQAFLGIISTSIIFAIFAANNVKHIAVTTLKRVFSLVLLSISVYLFIR